MKKRLFKSRSITYFGSEWYARGHHFHCHFLPNRTNFKKQKISTFREHHFNMFFVVLCLHLWPSALYHKGVHHVYSAYCGQTHQTRLFQSQQPVVHRILHGNLRLHIPFQSRFSAKFPCSCRHFAISRKDFQHFPASKQNFNLDLEPHKCFYRCTNHHPTSYHLLFSQHTYFITIFKPHSSTYCHTFNIFFWWFAYISAHIAQQIYLTYYK